MKKALWWRLLAALFAFALIAAACGDDDDTAGTDGATEEATEAADGATEEATEAADGATEEATEEATEATEEATEATEEATDDGGDDGAAPAGGLADDAVDGTGAAAWEAAVTAGNATPIAADESLEPFLITMPNLEGDPIGSFPEIREGAEAAVKHINEQLGGIGGDPVNGVAGRPIVFEPCSHGFDPNAATACADEIAAKNPNLNINGIEFFTPALYPILLAAGVPVVETVPIFVADFDTAGVVSPEGGCVVSFPHAAYFMGELQGYDKVAIVYSNTPPGLECYADTQERPFQYIKDTVEGFDFIGVPDNSGDPSDNDAVVQQVADFLEGAAKPGVYFGIQASDCNEILNGLASAGVETEIVASGSCIDDSVLSNPAAAGAIFQHAGYITENPELFSEFVQWEIAEREAALDRYGPTVPKSAFMRVAYRAVILAWQVTNEMLANGEDIDDRAAITAAYQGLANYHLVGGPPIDCTQNVAEFESVCQRRLTYATWDGETWDPAPGNLEYIDETDFLNRFTEAVPRATG